MEYSLTITAQDAIEKEELLKILSSTRMFTFMKEFEAYLDLMVRDELEGADKVRKQYYNLKQVYGVVRCSK